MKSIKFKYSIIGFAIGAILFGFIGVVVATNIASSTVDYVTINNNNVLTVEDALDDLYSKTWKAKYYEDNNYINPDSINGNGTGGLLTFVYWNDSFSGIPYQKNAVPSTTYATRELLEQNYGTNNFENNSTYIKSTIVGGVVIGHVICLWNNNREFCFGPNYWVGDNTNPTDVANATSKLKLDMELSLGITLYNSQSEAINANHPGYYCSLSGDTIACGVGNSNCSMTGTGRIRCGSLLNTSRCYMYDSGSAYCQA